jgi:hypothetical protein
MSNTEKLVALLVGIVVLAGVVELLAQLGPLLVVLAIVGYVIYQQRQDDQEDDDRPRSRRRYRRDDVRTIEPTYEDDRPSHVDRVHPHALAAVRQARLDPDRVRVLPVDIGLMTFKGSDDPVIHRTWPVEDDNDYVQPFVQLRVPQVAVGRVKFEIRDHYHQRVFSHEDNYHLERGRNLVIPSTRLPLHDEQDIDGRWELRVYGDGVLLAVHAFEWQSDEDAPARDAPRTVGEDGELNSELRAVLSQSRLEQMSLDDLLGEQMDDDEARSQR